MQSISTFSNTKDIGEKVKEGLIKAKEFLKQNQKDIRSVIHAAINALDDNIAVVT